MVVHDGHSCACPTASCFPFLGSDHKLITFEVLLEPCGTEATAPCWPRVRDWRRLVQALRPQLLSWWAKVSSFRRDGCHYSADACRSMLDVLYGEFVQMFWVAANPRDSIKRQDRLPQPDWWDDEWWLAGGARSNQHRQARGTVQWLSTWGDWFLTAPVHLSVLRRLQAPHIQV